MRRLIATTLGTLATVAVVLVLVLGFGLAGSWAGHSAARPASAPVAGHAGFAPMVKPVAKVHPNAGIAVTITGVTTFSGVNPTPAPAFFTIGVAGTNVTNANISGTNVTIWVTFVDLGSNMVTNTEVLTVAPAQTTYEFNFSSAEVHPDMLGTPTGGQWYSAQITVSTAFVVNISGLQTLTGAASNSTAGAFVFPASTPPSVTVTLTGNTNNIHGQYLFAPQTITFSIAVTGVPIDPTTVTLTATFVLFVGTHGHTVATDSIPVVPAQTAYSFNVTNQSATGGAAAVAPGGLYQVKITAVATNLSALVTDAANASSAPSVQTISANFIFSHMAGSFVAPIQDHFVGLGNVSVVIFYSGDFILNANVTIYRGTTTSGIIVYASPTFSPGAGNKTVAGINPWVVTAGGTYLAVLALNASYASSTWTELINVSAAGGGSNNNSGTAWYNTTVWHNSTLIPGLSTAAGGTLLLVVGLIVGLLVALVLGRMMWGSAKAAPAQAWQPKPGTNECSVCHQQFPSEDALKDHQKTAHGMT